MINTKPTSAHIASIKQYKRLIEKWDMWDFAYFNGKDYYFLAQYTLPIKGITGYLILTEKGEILPFSEAREPAYRLVLYNTLMHFGITQILPQMKKDMSSYKEIVTLMETHKEGIVTSDPTTEQSVNRIIEYTVESLKNPEKIEKIFYTLADYQNMITKKKGFFDDELLATMQDEGAEYSKIMYLFGIRQRELTADFQIILDIMEDENLSIPLSEKRKITKVLKAVIASNKGALEESMKTFERDESGEQVKVDRKNVKESLSSQRIKDGLVSFENIIIPKLRNPK